MNAISFFTAASLIFTSLNSVAAEEVRTIRVEFEAGSDTAILTDKIQGREYVVYKLNAREGQFLTVSQRPDNQSTDFNIYIPGRGSGDAALYASVLGGSREYLGQLYKSGDHSLSVFLNRAAARKGKVSNFDIAFRVTDAKPATNRIPADGIGTTPAESVTRFRR